MIHALYNCRVIIIIIPIGFPLIAAAIYISKVIN